MSDSTKQSGQSSAGVIHYTPGKWYVDPKSKESVITRHGALVADCAIIFPDKDRITENEANARLISAAPELLEACNNLFAVIEARWRNAELNDWQDRLQQARDAVAKATG